MFWPLFALAMGLVVGGSVVWGSLYESKPHYQSSPAKPEREHVVTNETGQTALTQKETYGGKQEGKWYQTFLEHTPDWFVAIFTALLTFVTYRLVVSTNRLWEAGERQLVTSRSVTAVQARNVRRQMSLSEDTTRRQLRAYVDVRKIRIKRFEKDTCVHVEFRVRNDGQTPAYSVVGRGNVGFATPQLGASVSFPFEGTGGVYYRLINPGCEVLHQIVSQAPLTSAQFDAVKNGWSVLYLVAEVSFTDAFGARRSINVRQMHDGWAQANAPSRMYICDEGNYTSESPK